MRMLAGKTAIAVDDDVNFLTSLALMLRMSGFEAASTATDGHQALSMLEAWRYDLIVSDWNMAPMDGLELLRTVKARPALSNIPFILVTASLSGEPWREALQCGVADFILKPFSLSAFRECCRLALDTHYNSKSNVISLNAHKCAQDREQFG